MKMRTKLLLFITLFTIQNVSKSQTYQPILNNSSWEVRVTGFTGSSNITLQQGSNITIGAYTYTEILGLYGSTSTGYYIREDVPNKKVYHYYNGADELLFDFSLQVSDIITLGQLSYTVTSVSTINVLNGTRKIINLTHYWGGVPERTEVWVEGVGSIYHPLYQHKHLWSDPVFTLTCSSQNGYGIYNLGIANGDSIPTDCSAVINSIEFNQKHSGVNFSPNPFSNEITITTPSEFTKASLKVYDLTGRLVMELNQLNGSTINVSRGNLKNGVYIFDLSQDGKHITNQKVVLTN